MRNAVHVSFWDSLKRREQKAPVFILMNVDTLYCTKELLIHEYAKSIPVKCTSIIIEGITIFHYHTPVDTNFECMILKNHLALDFPTLNTPKSPSTLFDTSTEPLTIEDIFLD